MKTIGKARAGLPTQIYLDESQERAMPPDDLRLAKHVVGVLNKHYPGHGWLVWASHEQGVVVIKLPLLTDDKQLQALGNIYGYTLHINRLGSDNKKIIKAGGELLERWGIVRSAYQRGAYHEAVPVFSDVRLPGQKKPNLVRPDGRPLSA